MKLISALAFLLVSLLPSTFGQDIIYDPEHNATGITGTWSSGSQQVSTGWGFAQPMNESFIYPPVTGMSYSFSDDGYYEIARYRYAGNGSQPTCITGVMNWCHGTYLLLPNGSIILTPLGDGYQQIQDPCAAVSNQVQSYNDTELYQLWQITLDPVYGYLLYMFERDGTPLPPMGLVSVTPNMLPTQILRNVSGSSSSSSPGSSSTTIAGIPSPATHNRVCVLGVGVASALALVSLLLL